MYIKVGLIPGSPIIFLLIILIKYTNKTRVTSEFKMLGFHVAILFASEVPMMEVVFNNKVSVCLTQSLQLKLFMQDTSC